MRNTKESILMTALELFAKDGYEAVSVSDIASRLRMTKGALYKHYKNKRDIFDSIVKRMYRIDLERARRYEVPEHQYDVSAVAYENISADSIKSFALAQFEFWVEDEFASDFRRMLSLEQYRDAEMAELYNSCITTGPVEYLEDIFRQMMAVGVLEKGEPKQLAIEFYAPLFLLICIADRSNDKAALLEHLKKHIDGFFQRHQSADKFTKKQ